MKIRENVRKNIQDNYRKCWFCGADLTDENINTSRYHPKITCHNCGFRVEATAKSTVLFEWIIVGIMYSTLIGIAIGFILESIL